MKCKLSKVVNLSSRLVNTYDAIKKYVVVNSHAKLKMNF